MDATQRKELCRQLGIADTSLEFLIVLLLSIGLSGQGVAIQREGLCRMLRGEGETVPDVFPIRLAASALVIVALTYFFGLSLDSWEESRGGDCLSRRSADRNAWASLLVLAAALIRLWDLVQVRREQPALEEDIPPA